MFGFTTLFSVLFVRLTPLIYFSISSSMLVSREEMRISSRSVMGMVSTVFECYPVNEFVGVMATNWT